MNTAAERDMAVPCLHLFPHPKDFQSPTSPANPPKAVISTARRGGQSGFVISAIRGSAIADRRTLTATCPTIPNLG